MAIRKIEKALAILAALALTLLTIYLWGWISTFQTIWLFPALYLIELVLLGWAALAVSLSDFSHSALFLWVIAGVFLGFFFIAGFSIGPFYAPFSLLFAAMAVLSDIRRKGNLLGHAGLFLLGGLAQVAVILLIDIL